MLCTLFVYVVVMLQSTSGKLKEVARQNEGALAERKTAERQPIICHFQDTHFERDLRFSLLDIIFNGNHTGRML